MSDDNKTPAGTPKGTDPMAKARAAKAAKAAAKPPEPEMEIVEREVTETTHKTTPTGQEKTKTVKTVFRPKAAPPEAGSSASAAASASGNAASTDETTAKPEFTEAERAGIERAGQKAPRSKRPLYIALGILVLIVLAAVYVFTADPDVGETANEPPAVDAETIIEGDTHGDDAGGDTSGEVTEGGASNGNAVEEPTVVTPTPPSPKPEPRRDERAEPLEPSLENASPPPPSPERNMTAYVMRPFGDRRDDFIVYDFDFRRVCVTNSSERAELPQSGCMAYESLSAEWTTTYDQLCRRYYAFPEVCPADITVDVVLRELQYHEND